MTQFHVSRNKQWLSIALSATALLAIAQAASATDGSDLRGEWRGSSRLEGQHAIANTTLSLGSADSADAEMRIEGTRTCTLKKGSYATQGSGDNAVWQLSFKESTGGENCAKIASASFAVRADSKPHRIQFEVSYTDADGQAVKRVGMLNHYP